MALKTDREKCAHLLRRFALGASEAELDYYLKDGFKGAIDKLLNYEQVPEALPVTIDKFLQGDPPRVQVQGVSICWHTKLLVTRRPLLEKMTVFWHDHFATSALKVNVPPLMADQVETIRGNATGKFEPFLVEMSKDPAMLFWLDNQFNVKGKPNENFAREVMELFSLGIGHYTEKDVQEAARAFTGWAFRRPNGRAINDYVPGQRFAEFLFRPRLHDTDPKTLLGQTGPFGGEEVVDILCNHPQTPKYIALKVWEWFAYANPAPALVERLAAKFKASDLDIKVLLREVMEAPEFYSDKTERAVYKNPIDFTVVTLRQLGMGELVAQNAAANGLGLRTVGPAAAAAQAAKSMGMALLFPPDVAGWETGPAWISSATMVERIQWADRLFGTAAPARGRLNVRVPAYSLFAADPTPEGAVKKLVSIFDAPMPASKVPNLVAAAQKASGGTITQQNANATAAAVTRLIFGSPEFQFI
jgi:uncharacterized protein (DUF1800 family)